MKALMTKRTFILVMLFLFAFWLRLAVISKGPFHYDTLDLAIASLRTFETMRLHYEHGMGYPLTVIIGSIFIFIFRLLGVTDPVFCINFMTVCAGALNVLLLFFLVEKLLDFHKAMFSAILLATFVPHIVISTFGKSLTLSICFSLASAYYMVRYIQEGKNKYLVFSSIFLGFVAAGRLSDIFVVLPILYLYFSAGRINYTKVRNFVVFGCLAAVTGFLYYVPIMFDRGLSKFFTIFKYERSQFLGLFVFKKSWIWLYQSFLFYGILLILAGLIFMAIKRNLKTLIFLLLWFLVFQFFYGNVTSSNMRYLVIAWIPLIVAEGNLLGSLRKKTFYVALLAVLFSVHIDFLTSFPVLEFRHRRSLQIEFAQWVAEKTGPEDVIITVDEGPFIEYYGKRKILSRPIACNRTQIEAFFDKEVDALLEENRRVYVIGTAFEYDDCNVFLKTLFDRHVLILIGANINEDWHHAFLNQVFVIERLFEIKKK